MKIVSQALLAATVTLCTQSAMAQEESRAGRISICLPKGSIEIFGTAPSGYSFSREVKPPDAKYRFAPEYNYGSDPLLEKALSPEGMRGQVGNMYHSLPFDFEGGYTPLTNIHGRGVGTGLTYSQEYANIKYRGTTYVFSGNVADIPSGVSKIESTGQHCYIDFAYLQMLRKIFLVDSCQKANANFASQKPYAEQVCKQKESPVIHGLETASRNLERMAIATLWLIFLAMVIDYVSTPRKKK